MHFLILLLLILALFYGPSLWAGRVLKQHSKELAKYNGTGGEFAAHLIKQLGLNVSLETTEHGDHYDPMEKVVRLSADNFNNKSLTAMVVAAHEVGHALQHHLNYRPLVMRTQLAHVAYHAERVGALFMYAIPVVAVITRAPASGFLMLLLGLITMSISSIVHLVTLPVEFDASFKRALPVLKAGNYLDDSDMRHARKILLACALTYVAQSLSGLFNIWRWITVFRR
ncbi:MAG: zinc metallopeptidase [Gammaproteobacteria bacterium]|nr:zinc metallopeptidase [Gammaproteobacteria bacterium]